MALPDDEVELLRAKEFLRECAVNFVRAGETLGGFRDARTKEIVSREVAAQALVDDWRALWNAIEATETKPKVQP